VTIFFPWGEDRGLGGKEASKPMFNIVEPGARNRYGSVVCREPVLFLGAAGESVWFDGLIWGTRCYASRDVVVVQRRLGGLELEAQKERGA
jgi:hypothetical protein